MVKNIQSHQDGLDRSPEVPLYSVYQKLSTLDVFPQQESQLNSAWTQVYEFQPSHEGVSEVSKRACEWSERAREQSEQARQASRA